MNILKRMYSNSSIAKQKETSYEPETIMVDGEEHAVRKPNSAVTIKTTQSTKIKSIEINGEKFEVVNVDYVENLERELYRNKREIRSLNGNVNNLINSLNSANSTIATLQREMVDIKNNFRRFFNE